MERSAIYRKRQKKQYEEFIGILTFVIQDVISFLKELGYKKDEGAMKNENS